MEDENIEIGQELPNNEQENQEVENQDSQTENYEESEPAVEDVSHETEEPEGYQEDDSEALRREISELKEKQYQHEMQMRQIYGDKQTKEEKELTYLDVMREGLEQLRKEEQEAIAQANQQRLNYEFEKKLNSFKGKVKDFDSVVRRIDCITPAMYEMLKASDSPGPFAYNAAKNYEQDLKRISTLSNPQQQMREMVLLEYRIKASLKPRTVSKASAPLSATVGTAGLSQKDFDPNDIESFARHLRENKR